MKLITSTITTQHMVKAAGTNYLRTSFKSSKLDDIRWEVLRNDSLGGNPQIASNSLSETLENQFQLVNS